MGHSESTWEDPSSLDREGDQEALERFRRWDRWGGVEADARGALAAAMQK